jgi:hypothetical protein
MCSHGTRIPDGGFDAHTDGASGHHEILDAERFQDGVKVDLIETAVGRKPGRD